LLQKHRGSSSDFLSELRRDMIAEVAIVLPLLLVSPALTWLWDRFIHPRLHPERPSDLKQWHFGMVVAAAVGLLHMIDELRRRTETKQTRSRRDETYPQHRR
jgi:hypothetical protein